MDQGVSGPPLQDRTVGLAESPLLVALDPEWIEDSRGDPGQLCTGIDEDAGCRKAGGVMASTLEPNR